MDPQDQHNEVIARLIRIEERQMSNVDRFAELEKDMEKIETRLDEVKGLVWKVLLAAAGSGGVVAAGAKFLS